MNLNEALSAANSKIEDHVEKEKQFEESVTDLNNKVQTLEKSEEDLMVSCDLSFLCVTILWWMLNRFCNLFGMDTINYCYFLAQYYQGTSNWLLAHFANIRTQKINKFQAISPAYLSASVRIKYGNFILHFQPLPPPARLKIERCVCCVFEMLHLNLYSFVVPNHIYPISHLSIIQVCI